jgi:histidinol-phosphate/aromatic aminotransferase/cobyric acid decarboxylase-like protein
VRRVHLFTPTYALFPEIAERATVAELDPDADFSLDLALATIPRDRTLVAIVNPSNPTGTVTDLAALPELLRDRPVANLGGRARARPHPARRPHLCVRHVLLPRRLRPPRARVLAEELLSRGVLLKPLDDPRLGRGMVRVTTSVPEDNERFLALLELLLGAERHEVSH